MPHFGVQFASAEYLEELFERGDADTKAVSSDWKVAGQLLHDFLTPVLNSTSSIQLKTLAGVFAANSRHLYADLDPLGRPTPARLLLLRKAAEARWKRLDPNGFGWLDNPAAASRQTLCAEIGHVDDLAISDWIESKTQALQPPSRRAREGALRELIAAEEFERFMALRFVGKKRFGAEGVETIIPLLNAVIDGCVERGAREIVLGSMHRGRLNILANVLHKSLATLFAEMKEQFPFFRGGGVSADVPYHLGLKTVIDRGDRKIALTLLANPSHLEAINPVALGYARARQDALGGRGSAVCILLHTDASVIAQGSVSEIIQLGAPSGFTVDGTIHIVLNNQIGFTTEPKEARSSLYCTGAWKAVDSLILHLNGEDPDATLNAAGLAVDFRSSFGKDAVIDLVCYRRNGHNEIDEPRFTQPLYYLAADKKSSIASQYQSEVGRDSEWPELFRANYRSSLQTAYEHQRIEAPDDIVADPVDLRNESGADPELIAKVGHFLTQPPDHFAVSPKLGKILSERRRELSNGVSWAFAEALAFGSLLYDGVDIRFTGQDVERGSFSHRHLAFINSQTGDRYIPLAQMPDAAGSFSIYNSPLSEYAVLGFEYGYSLGNPRHLVIWEAQFGDFMNGAQIVFDQFISSAAEKWLQRSSLVVLLPHGLEGQGPEHSSARPERILQAAARDNMRIAHPSTPASYFHLLRTHARAREGVPLIVLTPKKLLRLAAAVSPIKAFASGTVFQRVLVDPPDAEPNRIVLCSGKIAYELLEARSPERGRRCAVVRLEQLYPFPEAELQEILSRWPLASL
ncbi:MAG: 2-oxoglutarate dehydrogenase E1 component, partial [Bdellovibrionales bacterium]|nr:2-oxoglutarate dehydrogenase E1 component [Bdellovibrionales bacterium]